MDRARYLDLFLAESREHLGAAHTIQSRLEQSPDEPGLWRDFMRHAHSLKGMAAAMQYTTIVELAHALETLADRLATSATGEAQGRLALLGESLACLGSTLDQIERGEKAFSQRAVDLTRALQGSEPCSAPAVADSMAAAVDPSGLEQGRHWQLDLALAPDAAESARATVAVLRRIGELGRIVQSSPPPLALDTGRFQGRLALVLDSDRPQADLEHALHEIVGRAHFSLREALPPRPTSSAEGPPARWIRVRSDRLDNVIEAIVELRREHLRLKEAVLSASGQVGHHIERCAFHLKELYGSALELRLVPFETLAQRFHQTVHDLAAALHKQVRFEISGGEVLVDRVLLDALVDPLAHALRNAVDHGIELPHTRKAAGKPARGRLWLDLSRTSDRIDIVVGDDGQGMDPALLRRTAVARGILSREEAIELTDREALLLTTFPRFTTRRDADHVSGRGLGLEIVRARLEILGGYVEIRSQPGRGCELHLCVPLRRALIRTLLVRSAGGLYALPLDSVVGSADPKELGAGRPTDRPAPRPIPLATLLGIETAYCPAPIRPRALILASGEPPTALVVDDVLGRQDLVVQPLHAPLTELRQYSGAAVLEDGSIALVLDAIGLIGRARLRRGAAAPSCGSAP